MGQMFILSLMLIFAMIFSMSIPNVLGQTETSEQTTLWGNLANDPVAQDILKKIELTKKWIADLEQRNYEQIQSQKELNQKRAVTLDRLNQDLKDWEILWEQYSSRNAFEKFVSDKPEDVKDVFWDQFEFKEVKVKAGRDALKKVLADGGSLREAREAYLKAAETKRIELIEANAQFNVKHNLAYYRQQILFDIQGQFVNTIETRERLSQYYTDFRASPAYLAANPNDALSYDELGETNPYTQCREGFVVVYRYHADDYVCTTESTAEMWILHGMGELAKTHLEMYPDGKEFGTVSYILDRLDYKEVNTTIFTINEQFRLLDDEFEEKQLVLVNNYDWKYKEEKTNTAKEERELINNFNSGELTKEEQSELIIAIRNKHKDSLESILDEKIRSLDSLKTEYDKKALDLIKEYESRNEIEIVWNSDIGRYEAITKSFSSPNHPIITGLVSSPNQIQLFWQSPTSMDGILVTGYKIEVKTDNNPYEVLEENTGNRNTSYVHSDLTSGEFYTYRISAINDIGIGDPSREIRASAAWTES